MSALQGFIFGSQAGNQLQQQQLNLQQQRELAPLQVQAQKQALQAGAQSLSAAERQKRLQGAQLMQQVVNRVKQVEDPAQRLQIFQQVRPELEQYGVSVPDNLTLESVTDQGLIPLETGLGQTVSELTAFERERNARLSDVESITDPQTGQLKQNLTPREKAIAIRERLLPGATGSASITQATTPGLAESVAESEKTIQAGKERGKGIAKTERTVIQEGLDAAKGIPVLKRSLSLLDEVRTGGFNSALLRAKQLFNIEGADEGELSANLGQAVLGDLRQTFGAAFTEKEGERLERIRANFGRSPAVNKRLINQALQIAEDSANRAIDRAIEAGDTATAEDIQTLLDFSLNDEAASVAPGQSFTSSSGIQFTVQ